MKKYFLIALTLFSIQFAFSQSESKTLMTIDNREISNDEFLRIYNKNKNIAEDLQKSVDEYIDLFINYKLKVIEAENLGYDTMSSFIKEMGDYTEQLTDSYINKKEILDTEVKEAYQRSLEEIKASHVLFRLGPNALPKDTLEVYNKIMGIRERLVAGEDFQTVIDEESLTTKDQIGQPLGWFSAFRMVYPFEIGAYNTPVGEISMPLRSQYGYHLILVEARRKNRGEVEAAHIMTMASDKSSDVEKEAAKQKIEKAYAELQQGASWDSVVYKYSEHKATAAKKGYIGWLNSTNSPEALLDSCFSVELGSYSQVTGSPYGYHIIKPLNYKPVPPFEEVKEEYLKKLRKDPTIKEISEDKIVQGIKKEYGFKFFAGNADTVLKLIDSTIYENKWDPGVAKDLHEPIITIGDKNYTQYDLAIHISKERRNLRAMELERWFYLILPEFIDNSVIDYERDKLPEKYPELKYLLEEYHDGILLFNLTEDEVWQKAIDDSVGIEKFYNELSEKYSWDERISITKYSYTDSLLIDPLLEVAKTKTKKDLSSKDIISKLCTEDDANCMKITDSKYEKGDNALVDSIPWKKGEYIVSKDKYNFVLYYVNEILPAQEKTLDDARGLYTADYQSLLEDQWVEKLRNKYSIEFNEEVMDEIRSEYK